MIAQALQEYPRLPLIKLCEVLGVSRSWFYTFYTRQKQSQFVQFEGLSEVRDTDVELRAAIEEIALEFPGYGYRRVTKALA